MDQKPDGPRAAGYLFLMSRADRTELKRRAAAEGMAVQGYLERAVFGYSGAQREPGRPVKNRHQPPLDGLSEADTSRRTG